MSPYQLCELFRIVFEIKILSNLSKNESKVFDLFISKTLTWNKTSDALTDWAIAAGTGIRTDRAMQAVESLINKGLFTRMPTKISTKRGIVDGYRYYVAPALLGDLDLAFFGTEKPESSPKSSPKNGYIQKENNTHKKQHNTPTEPDTAKCSRRQLEKPQNIDQSTYETLLPALGKLKTATAQNVLGVLSCAISDQSIQTTPTRLGFGLIKHAIAGLLNTACLQNKQQQQQKIQINQQHVEKAERAAEINGLRQQAKLLGISLQQHAKNLNQLHLLDAMA